MSHDRGCFKCGEDVSKAACARADCPRAKTSPEEKRFEESNRQLNVIVSTQEAELRDRGEKIAGLARDLAEARKPIPMRLACERCGKLHVDEGEFAAKPHHTHACQHCGAV